MWGINLECRLTILYPTTLTFFSEFQIYILQFCFCFRHKKIKFFIVLSCGFLSHNPDFFSCKCKFISRNSDFFLWIRNLHLTILIFVSDIKKYNFYFNLTFYLTILTLVLQVQIFISQFRLISSELRVYLTFASLYLTFANY